jgi:isopentenyldiphosphate isomerase
MKFEYSHNDPAHGRENQICPVHNAKSDANASGVISNEQQAENLGYGQTFSHSLHSHLQQTRFYTCIDPVF